MMTMPWGRLRAAAWMLCLLLPASLAQAQDDAAQAARVAAARQVFDAAQKAAQTGPAEVPLAAQARLNLPSGFTFVPQPHAQLVLNAMGNPGRDPHLHGLLLPGAQGQAGGWFVVLRFEPAGYIKDDDARDWHADDLFKSLREGTEESNPERIKMGGAAIEVLGWAERPAYDAATHRLVWAMSSREKGAPTNQPQGVNYNTYMLGREGYFSLNLVTDLADLPNHKIKAQQLLASLNFDDGKRYADFNPGTDRVAEYGLAALVVGAAAKKFGLIAVALGFFAKFSKIILIGLALFGGAFWKLIGRRKKAEAPLATAPAASVGAPPTPPA